MRWPSIRALGGPIWSSARPRLDTPYPNPRARLGLTEEPMPQPKHLMKLKVPYPKAAPPRKILKKFFAKCQEKLGLVPNVLRAGGAQPAKLRTFTAFYNELMLDEETAGVSKLEREMIAVVVSSANRCYYCLVAHGQAVRELSGDPQLGEMMVMNYRVAELAPRTAPCWISRGSLPVAPHDIGEADRQALRDLGFSDADIFDICDVAAFFNYSNRMAHGLDMMPNAAYHGMHR